MIVAVTQYKLPDGRQVATSAELSDDLQPHYEAMLKRGWRFAAEVLCTGDVSLTIEDIHKEEDVEIEIVKNGPGVQSAMEQMLRKVPVKGVRR